MRSVRFVMGSQTVIPLVAMAKATRAPPSVKATALTWQNGPSSLQSDFMAESFAPDVTFQSRSVPPIEPVARRLPSGLNARLMPVRLGSCPRRTCSSLCDPTSHSRVVPSERPAASFDPSGANTMRVKKGHGAFKQYGVGASLGVPQADRSIG